MGSELIKKVVWWLTLVVAIITSILNVIQNT